MSNFFFNLDKQVDTFNKTRRSVSKTTKAILYEGLNYQDTKSLNVKDLILFIERDIYLAIEQGEIPKLEIKFEFLTKKEEDFISATIFEVQTSDFYNIENRSLSLSKNSSSFCDRETLREKLSIYIKRKIEQILLAYNRLKISSNVPSRFRFKYGIQVKLDHVKRLSVSRDEMDKLLDPYFEEIARKDSKRMGIIHDVPLEDSNAG